MKEIVEVIEELDKVFEPVSNTSVEENDEPFEESIDSIIDLEYIQHFKTYYGQGEIL